MKLRWLIPVAVLLPMRLHATEPIKARVATVVINPAQITPLHLRPEFESTIRMPEEVTSVILGSPGSFKAEHNEGEPDYVYVKPITKEPAQSNLLIATKSGQHVTLELISDGVVSNGPTQPVDFLIEYRVSRSFLVASNVTELNATASTAGTGIRRTNDEDSRLRSAPPSALEEEFAQQSRINAPNWTKWDGKQIQTSLGDIRQWNNQTVISYSILNSSDEPVEVVPPQIQIAGRKAEKKKKKEGRGIISDQLQIRDYKLSSTRLESGGRADGVVVFDRPNFKQSMYHNRYFPEKTIDLDRLEALLSPLTLDGDELPNIWYPARIRPGDVPYTVDQMGAPPKRIASHGRPTPPVSPTSTSGQLRTPLFPKSDRIPEKLLAWRTLPHRQR